MINLPIQRKLNLILKLSRKKSSCSAKSLKINPWISTISNLNWKSELKKANQKIKNEKKEDIGVKIL